MTDRDGTLIKDVPYLSRLEDIALLPGVAKTIRTLNRLDIPVVVVTNQSGVARGYFSEAFVRDSHERINAILAEEGARVMGARAYGFFITTEDGSSAENRVVSRTQSGQRPMLDYSLERIPASVAEHQSLLKAFKRSLLRSGLLGASKPMGLAGTAHALGSMVTGIDPAASVVDANGRVHGFDGLYVADGSILPRSSRVNPALTIYAWGLRLGSHLANKQREAA